MKSNPIAGKIIAIEMVVNMKKHLLSLLIVGFTVSSVAPLAAADPGRLRGYATQIRALDTELTILQGQEASYARVVQQIQFGERDGNLEEASANLKYVRTQKENIERQIAELEQSK